MLDYYSKLSSEVYDMDKYVWYSLSEKGSSLIPILEAMCEWEIAHQIDSGDND